MDRTAESGFTLIETALAAGLAALALAAAGAFYLAGPSGAAAAAERDLGAALDEARAVARSAGGATLAVARLPGGGFRARVYRGTPGGPEPAPVNGPDEQSPAAAEETAAPLGPPGFAFAFAPNGSVTGYAGYQPGAVAPAPTACPPAGAFVVTVRAGLAARNVPVPCVVTPAAAVAAARETPPPPAAPAAVATAEVPVCGGDAGPCPLPALAAAGPPPCPPGSSAATGDPGRCDPPPIPVATTGATAAAPPTPPPTAVPAATPSAAPPSPPPASAPRAALVETIRLFGYLGSGAAQQLVDSAAFSIYADGTWGPDLSAADVWACPPALRADGPDPWGGGVPVHVVAPDRFAAFGSALASAQARIYQEAGDTAGDGRTAGDDTACP